MAKKVTDHFDGYLFTFKAEIWEDFEKFFDNWSADHGTTEEWSSGPSKTIPKDAPIFLMKQGNAPTGIIAAGFTASENQPMDRWSDRKGKSVAGRGNVLRFTHFLDPDKDKLLDINDLPKQYWASRASGVGLPTGVFQEIKKRWTALLRENADEEKKAQTTVTLDDDEADDDVKIMSKDARATAIKQIKERRGQGKFRQKMMKVYGSRCAISGCIVAGVLEAAHIETHPGEDDNSPQNGLLLRADFHTLFDLLLIGIHPLTKAIHLHLSLLGSEYERFHGKT